MLNRIKNEPALVIGLVLALIGIVSAFGLSISDDQKAAIVSLIGAVLALFGAGVTRSKVAPLRRSDGRRSDETGTVQIDVGFILAVTVAILLAAGILALLQFVAHRA